MWEFLDWRTHHVMTTDVVTITPQTSLREAEALFETRDFSALPVLDAEGGLVGVVTPLDLLTAFRFDDTSFAPDYARVMSQPVENVMTRGPRTMTPMAPLTRVLDELVRLRVRSFPVMDRHALVGIVSRRDALVALRAAADGKSPPPEPYDPAND